MFDFLNDDFSNVFGAKRCTPDGEYYRLSKPEPVGKYKLNGGDMDTYTMVNKVEPKTIVVDNSLRIDRHDILLVLMLILILIVVKMLMSMYKLNTQFNMLVMNSRNNNSQTVTRLTQPVQQGIMNIEESPF